MSWFAYLPPIISIFLIVISPASDKYLRNLVKHFETEKKEIAENREVIANVALDWASRIGFINSMLVALVSCFSIFATTESYPWAVGTFFVLLVVFVWTLFWILSHGPGDLTTTSKHFGLLDSTLCSIILTLVYIALIVMIAISQVFFMHQG